MMIASSPRRAPAPTPFSPAALAAAHINPATGLATDYLNHFNEAIMLLELIPSMPECTDDFLSWEPLSYREHFHQSNFKGRDLAITAYDSADPDIRASFDGLCDTLTSILLAIRDAMTEARREGTRIRLAEQATDWLKPLVIRAGGVINGGDAAPTADARLQNDIDKIMSATA